jgi:hypothetical protein
MGKPYAAPARQVSGENKVSESLLTIANSSAFRGAGVFLSGRLARNGADGGRTEFPCAVHRSDGYRIHV